MGGAPELMQSPSQRCVRDGLKAWTDPGDSGWKMLSESQKSIRTHGVSFEEASKLFLNFPLEVFYDRDHSNTEGRYIAIGISDKDECFWLGTAKISLEPR